MYYVLQRMFQKIFAKIKNANMVSTLATCFLFKSNFQAIIKKTAMVFIIIIR